MKYAQMKDMIGIINLKIGMLEIYIIKLDGGEVISMELENILLF